MFFCWLFFYMLFAIFFTIAATRSTLFYGENQYGRPSPRYIGFYIDIYVLIFATLSIVIEMSDLVKYSHRYLTDRGSIFFHVISWIFQGKLSDKYEVILPVHDKTLFELLSNPGAKKFGSEEEAKKVYEFYC